MKIEQDNGDFFRCTFVPPSTRTWIRYSIPVEYRWYEDTAWHVHRKHLLEVAELAYRESGKLDYSSLGDYTQMEIAKAKANWTPNPPKSQLYPDRTQDLTSAYATLHLLPSAPFAIVHTVWRRLASKAHPDAGGDAEAFQRYTDAYNAIKKVKDK